MLQHLFFHRNVILASGAFLILQHCEEFVRNRPIERETMISRYFIRASSIPLSDSGQQDRAAILSAASFFHWIASFHTISSTSHFAPLPASVYKRLPDDGG